MKKWRLHNKILQLKERGFLKNKIAEKLGIARGTLNDYLKRIPIEMWYVNTKPLVVKLSATLFT